MKYNKPLVVGLLGALATVSYEIFTRVLLYLGIGKYSAYELTSLIITLYRPRALIGAVVSSVIGGFIAIIFYYSLKRLGWDYLILKSLAISLLAWVTMETFYVWFIEGPRLVQPRPIDDYYIHMLGSILFGLTHGLLLKRYIAAPIKKR